MEENTKVRVIRIPKETDFQQKQKIKHITWNKKMDMRHFNSYLIIQKLKIHQKNRNPIWEVMELEVKKIQKKTE